MIERTWMHLRSTWWGRILAEHHTEPTELILGGFLMCLIGAWLLLPMDTMERSFALAGLSYYVPEEVWGYLLMLWGLVHMTFLRTGVTLYRARCSLIGCCIWSGLTLLVLYTSPSAFRVVLFGVAAMAQGWCYIRLEMEWQNRYRRTPLKTSGTP